MNTQLGRVLALVAVLGAAACANAQSAQAPAPATGDPAQVVATVGSKTFTVTYANP